jgi:beta-1,4-mannosyl-glycoprotein beta-1,4-N-acetylglucosaminyltransferase
VYKNKIIDCFIFYNELELLKYRLNILYDIVDYFVIVESTHTFTGKEKNLIFSENKHFFEKFSDKIIHIIVSDFPHKYPTIKLDGEQWNNEKYQRNCIHLGIEKLNLQDNDLIIISDIDEILNPNTLFKIKNNEINVDINILEMDFYYYNLNSKINKKLDLVRILSYKTYKRLSFNCDQIRRLTCNQIRRLNNCNIIQNGGWHLSYFGDINFIKNKIEMFSHQEFNNDKFNNNEKISDHINKTTNLYNRKIEIKKIAINDNNNLPYKYDEYLKQFILF